MKAPHDLNPEDDQLDRLLGRTPLPQPDVWFTARTLARCRMSDPSVGRAPFFLSMQFWSRWALPGLCVLFAGGLSIQQAHRMHTLAIHHQHDRVREAFEVMASIDDDTDSSVQEPSL